MRTRDSVEVVTVIAKRSRCKESIEGLGLSRALSKCVCGGGRGAGGNSCLSKRENEHLFSKDNPDLRNQ